MAIIEATWNTGRYYGPNGQRIAATCDNKILKFADVDRCIAGQYVPIFEVTDPARLKQVVMSIYDANEFEPAWGDDIQALYDKAAKI